MSDLVRELRGGCVNVMRGSCTENRGLCLECRAAAEIERLVYESESLNADRKQLGSERDALRDALRGLCNAVDRTPIQLGQWQFHIKEHEEKARDLLEGADHE